MPALVKALYEIAETKNRRLEVITHVIKSINYIYSLEYFQATKMLHAAFDVALELLNHNKQEFCYTCYHFHDDNYPHE